jgi:hypothetical protein
MRIWNQGKMRDEERYILFLLWPMVLSPSRDRICKPFKELRNRFPAWPVGLMGKSYLTYRPARLLWLAESKKKSV